MELEASKAPNKSKRKESAPRFSFCIFVSSSHSTRTASVVMSGLSHLPIVSNAPNQLAEGIGASSLGACAPAPHPVALIERSFALQQDANHKAMLSRVYGSHLPMKLHMEQVGAQGHRGRQGEAALSRGGGRWQQIGGGRSGKRLDPCPIRSDRSHPITSHAPAKRTAATVPCRATSAERARHSHLCVTPFVL